MWLIFRIFFIMGLGKGVENTVLDVHAIKKLQNQGGPPKSDSVKYNYSPVDDEYVFAPCQGTIIALRHSKQFVDEITTGQECGILLDNTCFYAEQGGQIYDKGFLHKVEDESAELSVKNVQVRGGYVIHIDTVKGTLRQDDKVHLHLDESHVLNYALRNVVGNNAAQKGSLVAPDRLRFDFSNKRAMTAKQLKDIEMYSKQLIGKNGKVYAKESTLGIAKTINDLRSVSDPVRVVSIGVSVEDLEKDPFGPAGFKTSVEFCGGTHLKYAGHIGDFFIASEVAYRARSY